jgi:hypothetical protein
MMIILGNASHYREVKLICQSGDTICQNVFQPVTLDIIRYLDIRIRYLKLLPLIFRCEAFRYSVIPTQEESPLVRATEKGDSSCVGMTLVLTG